MASIIQKGMKKGVNFLRIKKKRTPAKRLPEKREYGVEV